MKRVIGFLLTLVMVLGLLPASVGAADSAKVLNACGPAGFRDTERITYSDAVAITAGLGLFAGKSDGRFDPAGKVNRAQMATVVVKMLKGSDFNADPYRGGQDCKGDPFPDTAEFEGGWAEGYINACRRMEVVSGYPDGTFHPEKEVTAAEALTMMLNALKLKPEEGEWPANVMSKAVELKLCAGLDAVPAAEKVLDREELAAIVSAAVQYKSPGRKALIDSVFGVEKINTEHQYDAKTKLCTVCRAAMPGVLTRADLEKAVVETAWAYLMKGTKLQYCSQVLDKVGKFYDGHYRVNEDAAPEYGTEDNTLYAVCADWTTKVYWEALGHRVLNGVGPLDAITNCMWYCSENQHNSQYVAGAKDPVTEDNVDFCVLRWARKSYKKTTGYNVFMGVNQSAHFANFGDYHLTYANGYYPTTDEEQATLDNAVREFFNNWDKNLRPGDIFCSETHALLYVGNGYILDCTSFSNLGGGKYDLVKGVDKTEPDGAVSRMQTVEDYLTTPGKNAYLGDDGKKEWFVVLRPTIGMVTDDGDGNLANDLVTDPNYVIPSKTLSREQFPAMEIDRTVSATPYGTVAAGEELTYTVKISNCSDNELYTKYHTRYGEAAPAKDYKALPVTETVPEGTKFVSASGDFTRDGDTLVWTLDIPVGQTAEVSYTVQVDTPVGSLITSDGGFVADVPSNSIVNTVGGAKLDGGKLSALKQIADTAPEQWREKLNISANTCDLDFAERIYQKMGVDLDLPTLAELVKNVFPWTSTTVATTYLMGGRINASAFMLGENVPADYQTARNMLLRNYLGGYLFFTGQENKGTTINEFRTEYLEPGDVLVYVTESTRGVPGAAEILVYAGQNTAGEDVLLGMDSYHNAKLYAGEAARTRLWNAFMPQIKLFFVLRPSQAFENINAAAFDPAKEPVYGAEPAPIARPTELGTTSLTADDASALQAVSYRDVMGQKASYFYNVYGAFGFDGMKSIVLNDAGSSLASATASVAAIFDRVDEGGTKEIHRKYARRAEVKTAIGHMLIGNFYGGEWLPEDGKLPTVGDLLPGDVIMLGNRYRVEQTNKEYAEEMILVYQGDGRFLASAAFDRARQGAYGPVSTAEKYATLTFADGKVSGEYTVSTGDDTMSDAVFKINDTSAGDGKNSYAKVDSFEDLLRRNPFTGDEWKFFFALRPTRGVYDIHDLDYAPAQN